MKRDEIGRKAFTLGPESEGEREREDEKFIV